MPDIGQTLREARMRAGIDITEVETATKIRAKYLRAIENEEWDLLPGSVYVKSFLRTYGDYLALDSRGLIDEYKRWFERPSDNELRPIATLSRERERSARGPLIPPWAIVAVVVIALVAALYLVGTSNRGSSGTATHAATATSPHHALGRSPHRRGAPLRSKLATVRMAPTAQVYVCIVDGNGRHLIPGVVYSPGQTIPAASGGKLLVTLGNASVRLRANGRLIRVPPSSSAVRYLISATGARPIALSARPGCP